MRMANLEDSVVTLAPYFKVNDLPKFKEIWKADYANFQHKVAALAALRPPSAARAPTHVPRGHTGGLRALLVRLHR